jgi:hypothetical protein
VKTLGRLFLGMAAFLIIGGTIYVIFSDESAGKVLLLLAAGLGLIIGLFLELGVDKTADDGAEPERGLYLPHSSIWPFWLGIGALVIANGFALGLWGLIPGSIIMAGALLGFGRQSRRRA